MIIERIKSMLEACEAGLAAFPPAELYNEDWLLRITLDWFARHGGDRYPMSPHPGARWFSQAWLPSAFLSRHRGDRLAEARTHADGVLGHFVIGDPGTAALSLTPGARQLVVLEAKLFARFSAGVRNAPFYDQAARTIACMAETLRRAEIVPDDMADLAFILLAPRARLDDGVFEWDLAPDAIRRKVRRRVEDYAGERDAWFRDWFLPTWAQIEVRSLSWEDVIEAIAFHSPEDGQVIDSFYGQCLRFNRPRAGRPLPRAPFSVRPRAETCPPLPAATSGAPGREEDPVGASAGRSNEADVPGGIVPPGPLGVRLRTDAMTTRLSVMNSTGFSGAGPGGLDRDPTGDDLEGIRKVDEQAITSSGTT